MAKVVRIDNYTKTDARKTRVAAYARVSTDSTEQLASLEAQKNYYEAYIKTHSEWEYAGLYYDEGVTGTKKDIREGLMKMLTDCREGKIDFIIVKSISRLARNTVDCLEIVRELYDLKVYVYFEKENINTSRMDSELLLTILSSIAESESKSISKNVKWSNQKRFEQGTFIIGSPPYGYHNENGVMVIVPEQAEIVKEIFSKFLSGDGGGRIAKELNERKVPSKHNGKWTANTVIGLLKNEKFTGDVIYQKTYTDNQFNRHDNRGEREKYHVTNHHEAIISHEEFDLAQALLKQHSHERSIEENSLKYRVRYPFSGKIICGECGATWKHRYYRSKCKGNYTVFVCNGHLNDKKTCSIRYIREATFETAFCTMMNKLTAGRDIVLRPFLNGLVTLDDEVLRQRNNEIDRLLEECETKRKQLYGLLIKQYLDSDVYNEENLAMLSREAELKAEKESIARTIGGGIRRIQEVEELMQFAGKNRMLTEFDEGLFEKFIDHITVISRNELSFAFRCGLILKEKI